MLAAIAVVVLCQTHAADTRAKTDPAAQIEALLAHIDRLAAAEPIIYGIDTRLRAADVLVARYPALTTRELRDAEASLSGVADADYANVLRVRMIATLAPFDFSEAQRIAKSIEPERTHDRLAEAYTRLLERSAPRDRLDVLLGAYRIGAFRVLYDSKQFGGDQKLQIFAATIDAFPSTAPNVQDISYLLDRAHDYLMLNRELTLAAIGKAVSAAETQPKSTRAAVRFRAAETLRALGTTIPEAYEALLDEPPPPKETQGGKKEEDAPDLPDLSNVPYSEALERSLQLDMPEMRAASLIELSRREDLTPKQQARVASEALTAVGEMPLQEIKLWGYSMLSRDFAQRQDFANAALAAQLLNETYGKACSCGGPVCEVHGDHLQCIDLIDDYAEYLDEFNFAQESLGLNNISLEARLLIAKLKQACK